MSRQWGKGRGRTIPIPDTHLPVVALLRQQQRRRDAVCYRVQRCEPYKGQDAQGAEREAQEGAGDERRQGLMSSRRRRCCHQSSCVVSPAVLRRAPFSSSSSVGRGGRSRGGEVAAVRGGSPHGRARGGRHSGFLTFRGLFAALWPRNGRATPTTTRRESAAFTFPFFLLRQQFFFSRRRRKGT